jgi:ATP-dependent 26S proteasome regulatory subunit
MIDPAIMRRGRFDPVIEVGMPTEDEVRVLVESLLAGIPTSGELRLSVLATRLAGRPLADAAFVVREAGRLAARAGKDRVDQSALEEALERASSRETTGESRPRIGFV